MSLYILDTDHISLFQRGHLQVTAHVQLTHHSNIAITIITAEEQVRGRLARIRSAKSEKDRLPALLWFRESLALLGTFNLLDYDIAAASVFASLLQQKVRIGTQDLRIAAIALSTNAILVTRNRIDFGQIPGLTIEDWTV
jgi:tRNA(fMet)-specific endonuclease VapC